jgi:DNA-binding NtrC family response regulator
MMDGTKGARWLGSAGGASEQAARVRSSDVTELRNVLAYGCAGDTELAAAFKGRRWNLVVADDFKHAGELIARQRFFVGLIALTDPSAQAHGLEELEAIENCPLWIALLPEARATAPDVEQVVGRYCYDFHTRPLDPELLLQTLGHAYGMSRLYTKLWNRPPTAGADDALIGASPAIQQIFRDIDKVARADVPVLISGETGTGKEHVAQTIHKASARAHGPFVAVNCAALPASLIQSELFGHERGAFTGAHERRIGHLELAQGGTIFLDEIGDIPPELQTNLLRFLEAKQIQRVGGTREISVDARVIAATNVDLEAAIDKATFRRDLYYRLHVLTIAIPSLRDRADDIEPLARYFFRQFANERTFPVRDFSQQALRVMQEHPWPGNVRELLNRVRRALVMADGALLYPRDLGLERRSADRSLTTLEDARTSAERRALSAALARTRNNLSQTARELGVSRSTLYRMLEKCGLAREGNGAADESAPSTPARSDGLAPS